MTMGKRQLVLAALIVALGAAVYLNWQFSGNNQLLATNALTSSQAGHNYGETDLVGTSSGSSKTSSASSVAVQTNTGTDTFTQAQLSRLKARDEAIEEVKKVIADVKVSEATKKEVVDKAAEIANNTIKENNIETMIKAKGFSDCVVFLQNNECSVVVKVKESSQNNNIVIKDIVAGQSGVAYDKIKIINVT